MFHIAIFRVFPQTPEFPGVAVVALAIKDFLHMLPYLQQLDSDRINAICKVVYS